MVLSSMECQSVVVSNEGHSEWMVFREDDGAAGVVGKVGGETNSSGEADESINAE